MKTTTMEVIQVFNNELQSLLDTKPPVSKAKMELITRTAMKGVKFHKHIVQNVEKFIAKCRPEYRITGLYVVDRIVRQSRHQFGIDHDVYATRFSRNLQSTFNNLFSGCPTDDKPKIVKILNRWQKNRVFDSQVIQPLLDMANQNLSLIRQTESTLSADSQTYKFMRNQFNNPLNLQYTRKSSSSGKNQSGGGLRLNKSILDSEYDDDDDAGDTSTEADSPLSSTSNKIETEQRDRNDKSGAGHQTSHLHWNRLLKQKSITNANMMNDSVNENKSQRSRSRSPPICEPTRYDPELILTLKGIDCLIEPMVGIYRDSITKLEQERETLQRQVHEKRTDNFAREPEFNRDRSKLRESVDEVNILMRRLTTKQTKIVERISEYQDALSNETKIFDDQSKQVAEEFLSGNKSGDEFIGQYINLRKKFTKYRILADKFVDEKSMLLASSPKQYADSDSPIRPSKQSCNLDSPIRPSNQSCNPDSPIRPPRHKNR